MESCSLCGLPQPPEESGAGLFMGAPGTYCTCKPRPPARISFKSMFTPEQRQAAAKVAPDHEQWLGPSSQTGDPVKRQLEQALMELLETASDLGYLVQVRQEPRSGVIRMVGSVEFVTKEAE